MPIKGRTDKPSAKVGFPLIGRIYKGDPKRLVTNKQGRQVEIMGKDTNHFRVEFELSKVPDPSVEDKIFLDHLKMWFRDIYGDKPTRFDDVVMIDETPDSALESWFEAHDGKGMLCQCDGETRRRWWNTTTRRMDSTPAPCYFQETGKCDCVPVGKLRFALGKFTQVTRIVGYFQIATHSNNDIDNIYAALWAIYRRTGDLRKISFTLTRNSIRMGYVDEQTGERGKTVKSLLSLFGNAEFAEKYILPPSTVAALPQSSDVPLIEAGDDLPITVEYEIEVADEAGDEAPPPRPRLMLKDMKLRAAFIAGAKKAGIDADEILDRCMATTFNDLEWYETAELLGIELDPPTTKESKK